MSEFSESYHIYTSDFQNVHKSLSTIGMNGYLFKPGTSDKWLSFVPFESFACQPLIVAKALQAPILAYFYAADHGWTVQLTHNGQMHRYECSWEHSVEIRADENFIEKIHNWLSIDLDPTLQELLNNRDIKTVLKEKPAYKFCQALGLQHFDWLSPQYVVADLNEYKKRKDTKLVGSIPKSAIIDQPQLSRIKLERSDLSALEAVEILTPHIQQWADDAVPDFISMSRKLDCAPLDLMINLDGRLTRHGAWRIRYISFSKGVLLWVALYSTGEIKIDAMEYRKEVRVTHWDLRNNHYDSSAVLQHTLQHFVPEFQQGFTIHNLVLSLREWRNQLAWQVDLASKIQSSSLLTRRTWVLTADKLTLLYENSR